jgi:hypothetical protein
MRTSLRICAAVAAIAFSSANAMACDDPCGRGYYGYSGYYGNGYSGYYGNGYGYNGNGYGYNGYNGYGYNGNGYYGNGYYGSSWYGNGWNGYSGWDGYDYDDDAPAFFLFGGPSSFYAPRVSFHGPSFYGPSFYGPNFYGPASFYRGHRWNGGCGRHYRAPVVYGRRWRRSRACHFHGHHRRARHYGYAPGPIVRVRDWRRW